MEQKIKFLKISASIVKIISWFLLILGWVGGIVVVMGFNPMLDRWLGIVILLAYTFLFFLLNIIVQIIKVLLTLIEKQPINKP